ncbi:MAG: Ig-like domain-containing protein, partial [Candidatus Latescibacteria bacterium]|nr:Ig-like domain-containing protein [Candidatus Latescibacterota bacterium]
ASGLDASSVAWGDMDNDGDLDLLQSGQSAVIDQASNVQLSFTVLLINDGSGGFADRGDEMVGLNNGDLVLGDVDGDGDLDLVVSGKSSSGERRTDLYRNGPDGLIDAGAGLPGVEASDLALGDYDRDGDDDLVIGGIATDDELITSLLDNDGSGLFTTNAEVRLPGIQAGDVTWADYDNDQDLDLILAGNVGQTSVLQIWENTIGQLALPDSAFALEPLTDLVGVDRAAIAMADPDGDGDLDLISSGRGAGGAPTTTVNDNLVAADNFPPSVPAGLDAEASGDTVSLSWQPASDDGQPPPPSESLSYNVRVGTGPGDHDVISGRGTFAPGNTGHGLSRRLNGLESGTYFWSVQTIDVGYTGSAFAAEQTFIIDTVAPEVSGFVLNKRQVGLGQTINLALEIADTHAGVDPDSALTVTADIGGELVPFSLLQYTGDAWSGELAVTESTPSGTATISIRGAVDRKGNVLTPFDAADAFVVDAVRPSILSRQPADQQEDVAAGPAATIVIGFSEPLDEATVLDANFSLRLGGILVPVSAGYDSASQTVAVAPESGLLPGSEYTVEVSSSLADLAGNRPADAKSWTFRTRIPLVVATTPAGGGTDVAVGEGRIEAAFDTPILSLPLATPGAVQVLREGQSVELRETPLFDEESGILRFEPAEGLRPGSRYEVTLSGLLGGPLRAASDSGAYRWDFATSVPQVVSLSPADQDVTVAVGDAGIAVTFDGPVDDQALAADGSVAITREGVALSLRQAPAFDVDTNTLRFEPAEGLRPGSRYDVVLSGLLGGPVRAASDSSDYRWHFETGVPQIVSLSPADDDTTVAVDDAGIAITFDGPVDDQALAADGSVTITREGVALALREAPLFDAETSVLRFEPAEGLRPGSRYEVTLSGLLGGPLRALSDSGAYRWQFHTAVPQVTSLVPAETDTTVNAGTRELVATFDGRLDDESLAEAGAVRVFAEATEIPLATTAFDLDANTLTIVPTGGLRPGTSYRVQIAADVLGPLAAAGISWAFSTETPQVVATDPADGTSIGAGNLRIQVQFSSAIAEENLLPRYFSLSQAGRPLTLAADEFLYDVETFAASLPAVEFVSGSSYRLVVSSRIGGPRAQGADTDISFTTDIPTVVGTVPDAGAEGISTGQSTLQATFSGRIARRDGTGFSLRARSLVDVLTEGDEAVFQVIPIAGFGTDSTLTVVSFSPEGGLQDFTEYEISIGSRVFGDLGEDGFTWRFSTAARLADAAAGGIVTNPDRAVELYLPPNALAASATEIRISPVATAAGKPAALAQDNVQVGRSFRIDAGDVT